ncbi:MAG: tetraacyldisaccharide 4'-kinase [Omnitrophica WOR_2 bacterium]
MEFLRLFLLPVALLYGLITWVRNKLFDWKLLPSVTYSLPVISVGNLSAGGTGKTPHVEYLLRLFGKSMQLATLSRGYGRRTTGFRIATSTDTAATIGDEPLQFHSKFPEITVATDESRRHGIDELLRKHPDTELIILDDAFQHRYVKPGFSILLTDYHTLYSEDYLLPYGTLRESRSGARRANLIVVTKTPNVLSVYERQSITAGIRPRKGQKVLFSYLKYGEIKSLWDTGLTINQNARYSVIMLIAGIANSYPLEYELRSQCNELIVIRFKDHHKYTTADFEEIKQKYSDIYTQNKLLITTEKDAMRMLNPDIREKALGLPFFYIPIEIELHNGDKQIFDETIINYVRENKRER